MKQLSTSLLLALGLALLAGCSAASDTGSVQLAVSVPQALSSSITRVKVTSSASDMQSIPVDLVATNGVWGGFIGNIPSGANRSFSAEASDASGTVLFKGEATGITISDNLTALVAITLQQWPAPPVFQNDAPYIESLSAPSTSVIAGASLALTSSAKDPNSDGLTYAWSSTAGTFSSASAAATSWTAPTTTGLQTLTLTVTDPGGLTARISLTINVLPSGGQGSAQLNISFNTSPVVASVSASASQLAVGQSTSVSASASDSDSDTLAYAWSATCTGTWVNASSKATQFTPTALPSGTCNNCNLTVTVSDGRGGQTTGTLALCVSTPAGPSHVSPVITRSYRSSDTATASQVLTYEVTASDPEGSALSFSWTANTGVLGTATNSASTSRTTWTAPTCVPSSTSPSITVTVTNAFNKASSQSFAVTGLPSCN